MSSVSSAPLSPTPSSPSHENLLGAILWLLPKEQIPDHGRYKLKAKACGHPCVIVQDCRSAEQDHVRICILTSYSQSISYNSLGASEQHHHVPIHPNKPNDRAAPSIVFLRRRQKVEVVLKKDSWINTRQVYKVPLSILRPYENNQSRCRYRLTDRSIRELLSALEIYETDAALTQAPRLSFALPVPNDCLNEAGDQAASPGAFLSPAEPSASRTFVAYQPAKLSPEDPYLESPTKTSGEVQRQAYDAFDEEAANTVPRFLNVYGTTDVRNTPNQRQYPFHSTSSFDRGPRSPTATDDTNLLDSRLTLPLPVTTSFLSWEQPDRLRGRTYCWLLIWMTGLVLLLVALTSALQHTNLRKS